MLSVFRTWAILIGVWEHVSSSFTRVSTHVLSFPGWAGAMGLFSREPWTARATGEGWGELGGDFGLGRRQERGCVCTHSRTLTHSFHPYLPGTTVRPASFQGLRTQTKALNRQILCLRGYCPPSQQVTNIRCSWRRMWRGNRRWEGTAVWKEGSESLPERHFKCEGHFK